MSEDARVFPKEEMCGLASQLRRASASVGANIAGGCGPRSDAEMKRFIQIARGSADEVEYHRLLARDLDLGIADERKIGSESFGNPAHASLAGPGAEGHRCS